MQHAKESLSSDLLGTVLPLSGENVDSSALRVMEK